MNSRHLRSAPSRGPVAPMHRAPSASPLGAPGGPLPHAPNAALLIDFDNVTMGIRSDLQSELRNLLSSAIVKGKVAVQRAYADWRRYPQYILPLTESSIDLIFAPAYGSSKKNATDIRLAVDAIELVFTRPEIGTFILLSGDSDFSSLVIKLKEYGKYVIGVGIRESSSDLLVMNCDEYYSYNALAGLVKTSEGEQTKRDPWELVAEAIQRMKRNGDVMRSDRLKQVMQEIDSTFDEKDLGMAKFSRFVQEAAQRGLVTTTKLENGQLEVGPPAAAADVATPRAGARPERSAEVAAVQPSVAGDGAVAPVRVGEEPAEDRARGRGRDRGRGRGRGRDREERTPRPATPEFGLASVEAPAEVPAASASPAVTTPAASTPIAATPAARVAQGRDEIGLTGERLTRNEAFDLVRRALESLVQGEATTSARAVRERAFALLGHDSESLSERNFARILRDAHDADVIDLRRRGDDYEVALATQVAPITEQLDRAAAAAQPAAAPTGPAAPRGMGPRGAPARSGRGRGAVRPGAPPMDLLSVGVIDAVPSVTRAEASPPAAATPAPAAATPAAPVAAAEPPVSAPASAPDTTPETAEQPAAEAPARRTRSATRPARGGTKTATPAAKSAGTPAATRTGRGRGGTRARAAASPDAEPRADAPRAPAPTPEPAPAPEPATAAANGAERPTRPRRPRARKTAARGTEE